MSNLIDRQAAIDALTEDEYSEFWDCIDSNVAADIIRRLPSAQPEIKQQAINSSDCIDRQSAIDAFNTNLNELVVGGEENAKTVENYLNRVLDKIKCLPPAQPKRGKWIKTARWGRVYYCDQCRNYLDFDGVNAGRGSTNFCPNCGADMRGEQDG